MLASEMQRVAPCCPPGGLGRNPVMRAARGLRAKEGEDDFGWWANLEHEFWAGIVNAQQQFPLDPKDAAQVTDDDAGWLGINWESVGQWTVDLVGGISDPLQSWFGWRNSIEQRNILDQRRRADGENVGYAITKALPAIAVVGGVGLFMAFRRK